MRPFGDGLPMSPLQFPFHSRRSFQFISTPDVIPSNQAEIMKSMAVSCVQLGKSWACSDFQVIFQRQMAAYTRATHRATSKASKGHLRRRLQRSHHQLQRRLLLGAREPWPVEEPQGPVKREPGALNSRNIGSSICKYLQCAKWLQCEENFCRTGSGKRNSPMI